MKLERAKRIVESGYVFASSSNANNRISKEDIEGTILAFCYESGLNRAKVRLVGSTGKMPTSGDIDIAVQTAGYDVKNQQYVDGANPEVVFKRLQNSSIVGKQNSQRNTSPGVDSYNFPINGNEDQGRVRIDVLFTMQPDWAEFAYFSAGDKSQYKGSIRNVLLGAVASILNKPGIDAHMYDDATGQLLMRVGRVLDPQKGLRRVIQHLPAKADGRYGSKMQELTPDEFRANYPEFEQTYTQAHQLASPYDVSSGEAETNPNKVVQQLFDDNTLRAKDVDTTEQVIDLIKQKFDPETAKEIFRRAGENMKGFDGQIRLPEFDS